MRHRIVGKKLGRVAAPRRALLRSMLTSMILHEQMITTKVKAKQVQPLVDKAVNLAKQNTLASRRRLQTMLYTQGAIRKLYEVIVPAHQDRGSGYTRITVLRRRLGDNAPEVQLAFVNKGATPSVALASDASTPTKKAVKTKAPAKSRTKKADKSQS